MTHTPTATTDEIMSELESLGTAQTVKTFRRHGADGPMFGVKVGDLKKVLKRVKGNQALALELWETGNSDAMYLASLAADGSQMTRRQLDHWAKSAWWNMLSNYAVPFVAAEHPEACAIAMKWIGSRTPAIACSGWNTYSIVVAVRADSELDLGEIQELLDRVERDIQAANDRVRYCMNGFVISVGASCKPLLAAAKATAKRIGVVEVDMGDTACKVPNATDAIKKVETMGRVGHKRKSTKC